MSASQLPAHVQLFLRAHIQTVLQLELLLLLHRSPERWWTVEAANRELRAAVPTTHAYLRALYDARLLERRDGPEPQFRYGPEPEQDRAAIDDLARLFRTNYYSTIDAIYAPRRKDIQDFANAFKLNKKDDEDG